MKLKKIIASVIIVGGLIAGASTLVASNDSPVSETVGCIQGGPFGPC